MSSNHTVKIYTDGSCLKNPGGASGWSYCILGDIRTWLVSGGVPSSTNNRMELRAVVEALATVSEGHYDIYTDSKLTINCAQGIWKRKANIDLWNQYDEVSQNKVLNWNWVKGHSGNEYNELVDIAARNEAKKQKNKNIVE